MLLLPAMPLVVPPAALHAQTAARVEALLNAPAVDYGWAADFVLEAAGTPAEIPAGQDGAFAYAREQRWLPPNAAAGSDARLNGVCLLLMRAFDIKGGLLYSLFKNAHYAYRELVWLGVLPEGVDPADVVSGEQLLYIPGRILALTEDAAGGMTGEP